MNMSDHHWLITGPFIGLVVGGSIVGSAAVLYLLIQAAWTYLGIWAVLLTLAGFVGWGITAARNEAQT